MTDMKRSSGILLHISSLPSAYGVGDLGRAAYEFVDFLHAAGQKYWQILPLNPTGFGDSPYQALSAFAGNPYFIDPEALCRRGWLEQKTLAACRGGADPQRVDYALLFRERMALLRKAYEGFRKSPPADFEEFCGEERSWLEDYSLFRALKERFGDAPWSRWERPIRFRLPAAMAQYRRELKTEMEFHSFLQYCFFTQWRRLKAYAREKGISLIGDIPIYVPMDSADVWAHPENFQLNGNLAPKLVAGCPPDGFNPDGQYWGHPVYDWEKMKRDGFSWWMERVGSAAGLYDMIRIDHFRGLESYWAIPARNKTARKGAWYPGPGRALIDALVVRFPETPFIAEDLGFLTPEVHELVRYAGYPGMKVLQFAFDGRMGNEYLPHHYEKNCICYSGSHDNDTLKHFLDTLPWQEDAFLHSYCGAAEDGSLLWRVLEIGMESKAVLFMAPMQDYLELGGFARMNVPGLALASNWCWRMLPGAASRQLAQRLRAMVIRSGRLNGD